MIRTLALVMCIALAACATALEPPQAPQAGEDTHVAALQQAIDEALATETSLRRRYTVEVIGVEAKGADLLFEIDLVRAVRFGDDERLDLIVACKTAQTPDCVRKAMAAVRAAAAR